MATKKEQPVEPQTTEAELGAEEVHEAVAEAHAKGYEGVRTDPTPLEHYTLPGVLDGKPTPESDPEVAGDRQAQHDIRSAVSAGKE